MLRVSMIAVCCLILVSLGCGNRVPSKGKKASGGGNPDAGEMLDTGANLDTGNTFRDSEGGNPDAANTCGNGVLEPGELCDPGLLDGPGACPQSCDAGPACTVATIVGSPESCDAQCDYAPLETCQNGDGCCPASCTFENDDDCSATCGDGVVDEGETCDGNCPTQCSSANACVESTLSGSPANCTAQCQNTQVTACRDADGCCPEGCDSTTDNDCACEPMSCTDVGATCGTIDDGCGGTRNCGACGANETCENNACVPATQTGIVGDACTSDGQCAGIGAGATCVDHPDYRDGYCSKECQFDNDCPTGSHCGRLFIGDPDKKKICLKNCSSDNDCRSPGYACYNWDSYDQNVPTSDECAPYADGTGKVGDPCVGRWQCSGGASGECLHQLTTNDGETIDFPDGYCISESCIPFFASCQDQMAACSDHAICFRECTTSSDCRSGYYCEISAYDPTQTYCAPL